MIDQTGNNSNALGDVKGYTKTMKSGRVVTVKPYQRTNEDTIQAVLKDANRPPMVGVPGKFSKGRTFPNIWAQDIQKKIEDRAPDVPADEAPQPPAKSVEEAAARIIDSINQLPDSPAGEHVKQILMNLEAQNNG